MRQVKTDLRGLNASGVLERARIALNGMKGNPHFPNPVPSMTDFATACDSLQAAIMKVVNGGSKQDFNNKDECLKEVSTMLKGLAAYAAVIAHGDPVLLMKAGFEYRRSSTRISSLNTPVGMQARTGRLHHTIDVRWKPVRGVRMYQLYICAGDVRDESAWQLLTTTSSSRYQVSDLKGLTYYSFRVRALGASAISAMSQEATALSIGPKAA